MIRHSSASRNRPPRPAASDEQRDVPRAAARSVDAGERQRPGRASATLSTSVHAADVRRLCIRPLPPVGVGPARRRPAGGRPAGRRPAGEDQRAEPSLLRPRRAGPVVRTLQRADSTPSLGGIQPSPVHALADPPAARPGGPERRPPPTRPPVPRVALHVDLAGQTCCRRRRPGRHRRGPPRSSPGRSTPGSAVAAAASCRPSAVDEAGPAVALGQRAAATFSSPAPALTALASDRRGAVRQQRALTWSGVSVRVGLQQQRDRAADHRGGLGGAAAAEQPAGGVTGDQALGVVGVDVGAGSRSETIEVPGASRSTCRGAVPLLLNEATRRDRPAVDRVARRRRHRPRSRRGRWPGRSAGRPVARRCRRRPPRPCRAARRSRRRRPAGRAGRPGSSRCRRTG